MAEKVKLHRCPLPTPHFLSKHHACADVEQALRDRGIEYEVVHDSLVRSRRKWVKENTGQKLLPAIEFADGSTYREESKQMFARIRDGKLFDADPPAS